MNKSLGDIRAEMEDGRLRVGYQWLTSNGHRLGVLFTP